VVCGRQHLQLGNGRPQGLGRSRFLVGQLEQVEPLRNAYKKAVSLAEPVGAYVNDNLMACISAYLAEDSMKARLSMVNARPNYLVSNVFRYHDTFPHPPQIPNWPNLIRDVTLEDIDYVIETGGVCGDPDEALAQVRRWEGTGVDQLVFGIGPAPVEETVEMIRLMGEHVIPAIDTDPIHRTSRMRDTAAAAVSD
jgi:alkanesulfonate monooxygenase SsuD/methylene tetrahydromethanopterin reductase-like flavin-dependent oxidoreductase (luciferase family)